MKSPITPTSSPTACTACTPAAAANGSSATRPSAPSPLASASASRSNREQPGDDAQKTCPDQSEPRLLDLAAAVAGQSSSPDHGVAGGFVALLCKWGDPSRAQPLRNAHKCTQMHRNGQPCSPPGFATRIVGNTVCAGTASDLGPTSPLIHLQV